MTATLLETLPASTRVATYERVSSDEQRERNTIAMQRSALDRALEVHADWKLVERYVDDGVSGTVPFNERPGGGRLMRDAELGLFDVVLVYDFSRMGRHEYDPLYVHCRLASNNVALRSIHEGDADGLLFPILNAMANNERKTFLRRSADGMNEAARQGRYCGGIVAYGYRVEGHKNTSHLVPAEEVPAGSLMSEAAVVRHIYQRLAADGWSCRRVAGRVERFGRAHQVRPRRSRRQGARDPGPLGRRAHPRNGDQPGLSRRAALRAPKRQATRGGECSGAGAGVPGRVAGGPSDAQAQLRRSQEHAAHLSPPRCLEVCHLWTQLLWHE